MSEAEIGIKPKISIERRCVITFPSPELDGLLHGLCKVSGPKRVLPVNISLTGYTSTNPKSSLASMDRILF